MNDGSRPVSPSKAPPANGRNGSTAATHPTADRHSRRVTGAPRTGTRARPGYPTRRSARNRCSGPAQAMTGDRAARQETEAHDPSSPDIARRRRVRPPLAAPAIVPRAGQRTDPHRRDQLLHRRARLHRAVPQRLATRGRAGQRGRRRARPQDRGHQPRRRRPAARRDPPRRRTDQRPEGRSAGRNVPVQHRPRDRRLRTAEQETVRRRRAADRRAGLGKGQSLHATGCGPRPTCRPRCWWTTRPN